MTTSSTHSSPARPEFDRRRDRRLLGLLAYLPSVLLTLAVVTLLVAGPTSGVGLMLLGGHFLTQFIVLLVYGGLLTNDRGLEGVGRGFWALGFLFAAPVALPTYYHQRVRTPAKPDPRGFAVSVTPLAA